MATEGLVRNRMEPPLKRKPDRPVRKNRSGRPTCPVHESCIVGVQSGNICVVREGLFSVVVKEKKMLLYCASVRNHGEAYVNCWEITRGIMSDVI